MLFMLEEGGLIEFVSNNVEVRSPGLPYLVYKFNSKKIALESLLDGGYCHIAEDSKKLITTVPGIYYGYFPRID